MLRSMFSAISGLKAHQAKMDVTGNNIANVNTVGYKSSATVFQDTLSQVVRAGGAPAADRVRHGWVSCSDTDVDARRRGCGGRGGPGLSAIGRAQPWS